MNRAFCFADYLDVEWFLARDQDLELREIQARDRALGLEARKQGLEPEQYFSFWLTAQRVAAATAGPSLLWARARTLILWLLVILGFVTGFFLVRGLLHYFGLYPVNVSIFLVLAVFPQFFFSLCTAIFLILRHKTHTKHVPWFSFLIFDLACRCSRVLPQAGFIHSVLRHPRYTPFFAWELLSLLQQGGMSFALGALSCLLGSVAVTDLAFGWQSTLISGASGMEMLVTVLSWPWSWLPMSWELVPSPEHIEGSRIILKDGISGLANASLASWWPFLSLCLFFYGLVPRVLLFLVAHHALSHVRQAFVHPDLSRIVDRMQAPLLDHTCSPESQAVLLPVSRPESASLPEQNIRLTQAVAPLGCVAIIPPELEGCIEEARLGTLVGQVSGYGLSVIEAAELEAGEVEAILTQYAGQDWLGQHERYVLVVEAWQPPIRQTLLALARFGHDQGRGRSVFLVLTGRPYSEQWLTPPDPQEERVWHEAVHRLAPLRVDILAVPTGENHA